MDRNKILKQQLTEEIGEILAKAIEKQMKEIIPLAV